MTPDEATSLAQSCASARLEMPDCLELQHLQGNAVKTARLLLGCILVRRLEDGSVLKGRIVEVEAYCGVCDQGSHSFAGKRTKKNESMYCPGGTGYVYCIHGYSNLNVICSTAQDPQGVLIRAVEPLQGLDHMRGATAFLTPRN